MFNNLVLERPAPVFILHRVIIFRYSFVWKHGKSLGICYCDRKFNDCNEYAGWHYIFILRYLLTLGDQYVTLTGTGTPVNKGAFTFIPNIVGPHPLGGEACGFVINVQ